MTSGDGGAMTMRRRLLASMLVGVALVCANTLPAAAATPADGWSYDLAREVMSPFCPGRTLSSCPSPQAAELIQWVILQEQAGATRAEVEDQLYERYGDVIRGAPKPEGWGLAAYTIPLLSALAGVGVVYLVLRRLSGGRGGSPSVASPAPAAMADGSAAGPVNDDEIARLVDEELEQI